MSSVLRDKLNSSPSLKFKNVDKWKTSWLLLLDFLTQLLRHWKMGVFEKVF